MTHVIPLVVITNTDNEQPYKAKYGSQRLPQM